MPTFEIIDAVQRSLENEGVLQSIRLQLRTSVLRVISNTGTKIHREDAPVNFKDLPNGDVIVGLIADALDALNLKETKLIFEAEAGIQQESDRNFLTDKLQLIAPIGSTPLLSSLIDVNQRIHDQKLIKEENKLADSPQASGNRDMQDGNCHLTTHGVVYNNASPTTVGYDDEHDQSKTSAFSSDAEIVEDIRGSVQANNHVPQVDEEYIKARDERAHDCTSSGKEDFLETEINEARAFVSEPLYSKHEDVSTTGKNISVISCGYDSNSCDDEKVGDAKMAQSRINSRAKISKVSRGAVTRSSTGWNKSASPQRAENEMDGDISVEEQSFKSTQSPIVAKSVLKGEVESFHEDNSFEKDFPQTVVERHEDLPSNSDVQCKPNRTTNSLFKQAGSDSAFGNQENGDDEYYEDDNFEDGDAKSETASSVIEEEYSFEQGSDSEEERVVASDKRPALSSCHAGSETSTMFKTRSGLLPSTNNKTTTDVDNASESDQEQDCMPRQSNNVNDEDEEDSVASEDLNAISVGENESDSEDMSF